MIEKSFVIETIHLVKVTEMIENNQRLVETNPPSGSTQVTNSLKEKSLKETKIIIEDMRRPSVVFNLYDLDKPRTKILPSSSPRRRSSSYSEGSMMSDDLPCFVNIPLIPAFLGCTLFIIISIFVIDDILNNIT